ncbi:DNA-directed RNA polymerase subunit omega [Brevibacillus sp. SYSU BS000544]|uniref:DNA-directed RNA polymerase subunit omega n=1 Tax=Brevibacillus sp. SYSU BS000544 TaxID=3416443 RepID=UPI003CE4B9C7
MIYPSIDKLTDKVDSKYILVTVASKRARQLREHNDLQITKPASRKFVGQALEELFTDKIVFENTDVRSK